MFPQNNEILCMLHQMYIKCTVHIVNIFSTHDLWAHEFHIIFFLNLNGWAKSEKLNKCNQCDNASSQASNFKDTSENTSGNHWFWWFLMVFHHWSNDGMSTYHHCHLNMNVLTDGIFILAIIHSKSGWPWFPDSANNFEFSAKTIKFSL